MDKRVFGFHKVTIEKLRELSMSGATSMAQLDYFLDALVYFADRHLPLLSEVQRSGPLLTGDDHESLHFWQYMTTKGLLSAALKGDELSTKVDIDYMADALLAPLRVHLFRFKRDGRGFSLERISAGLQTLAYALATI